MEERFSVKFWFGDAGDSLGNSWKILGKSMKVPISPSLFVGRPNRNSNLKFEKKFKKSYKKFFFAYSNL
jgi:hypothetical protein